MVIIMPSPTSNIDIPSKIKALQTSLSKCQTMFHDLDQHEKAEFQALEQSFVSTTTEMCEQLTHDQSNQAVSDEVAHDILDTANEVARHVSEKTPIPPKKVEHILALNSDNIAPQAHEQHQKSQTNAIIKLLQQMTVLATVVLTIIFPGPGTGLGLSIGAALISFLPDAYEAYKDLFQSKHITSSSDHSENLVLDNAKQLQQAYKQENQEQRENDPDYDDKSREENKPNTP